MRTRLFALPVIAGFAFALAGLAPASAAPTATDNPQQKPAKAGVAAAFAPDKCFYWKQLEADGSGTYGKTYNVPNTYNAATWTDVNCGKTPFTVPRGEQALVNLTATAELDCNASTADSWCESRFVVNGLNLAHPNNEARGDTFAWDSTNGGSFNWQAHTLAQKVLLSCPRSETTNAPCNYTATLQVQQQNGTPSLWLDDLEIDVDVAVGPTSVTTVTF